MKNENIIGLRSFLWVLPKDTNTLLDKALVKMADNSDKYNVEEIMGIDNEFWRKSFSETK